jgi:crotonyl-CoA carboxylase/reductase
MADLVPVGALPPLGEVPKKMYAQVIRQDRFGDPRTAFQVEEVDVPTLQPKEVLIGVMAAGINYNNVWAARGIPIDVIRVRHRQRYCR